MSSDDEDSMIGHGTFTHCLSFRLDRTIYPPLDVLLDIDLLSSTLILVLQEPWNDGDILSLENELKKRSLIPADTHYHHNRLIASKMYTYKQFYKENGIDCPCLVALNVCYSDSPNAVWTDHARDCQHCGEPVWDAVEFGATLRERYQQAQLEIDQCNKKIRFALYRHFVMLKYGYLGRKNRREPPKCVKDLIKGAAPNDPDVPYVGFQQPTFDDDEDEDDN